MPSVATRAPNLIPKGKYTLWASVALVSIDLVRATRRRARIGTDPAKKGIGATCLRCARMFVFVCVSASVYLSTTLIALQGLGNAASRMSSSFG